MAGLMELVNQGESLEPGQFVVDSDRNIYDHNWQPSSEEAANLDQNTKLLLDMLDVAPGTFRLIKK